MEGPDGDRRFRAGDVSGAALKGKRAQDLLTEACASADLVVIDQPVSNAPEGCLLFDREKLSRSGPLALYQDTDGLTVVASSIQQRVWSSPRRPDTLARVIRPKASRLAARQ